MDEFNNILVLGMGKSGLSAVRLLKAANKNVVAVNSGPVSLWGNHEILKELPSENLIDQQDPLAKKRLKECDLVILSPGISCDIDFLKDCCVEIWSEIELGYQFCDSPIVAITGTNGKTTTVSFLNECLIHEGREFFVGGNIGTPLCDYAYELITKKRSKAWLIVLELSSFQLESTLSFSPSIAAILNLTFSHGERYDHLSDYALAKRNIFNKLEDGLALWPKCLWDGLDISQPKLSNIEELDLENLELIKSELSAVIKLSDLKIYGTHNLYNLYFAMKIWKEAKGSKEAFIQASKSFAGVEYRLEDLGQRDGLHIFNDAKSTNWQASVTAINGVKQLGDIHLILGGQKRGEGDTRIELLDSVKEHISSILLIGESGRELEEILRPFYNVKYVEDLKGVKKSLKEHPRKGVLLFSPAFPSFDQYKNYIQRGREFSRLFSDNN